jgi:hypothetical protein
MVPFHLSTTWQMIKTFPSMVPYHTLLEIMLFATNHYAVGMQLVVICNYKFGIV